MMMTILKRNIDELSMFMRTDVYALLDTSTKAGIINKKAELCGIYFMMIAKNLHRNKIRGCYAPHKAVLIISIIELVESGHIKDNVICLDHILKDKFKEVWDRLVPTNSPFVCGYHNPFKYMESEQFWQLTGSKGKAIISWEAFDAFSHPNSRVKIKEYLKGTIVNDTISLEYKYNNPDITAKVAEDIMSIIPLVGILMAV